MKILLDENIPKKARYDFGNHHEVRSVNEEGWKGKRNAELLQLMVDNGYTAFIPVDQNLQYQQNLKMFPLTIFVLKAKDSRHQTLQPLLIQVQKMVEVGVKQRLIEIG